MHNFVINSICSKKIMNDVKLLTDEPLEYVYAFPTEENMLIWYFMIIGPEYSKFNGGHYIGKLIHDSAYPFVPPSYIMLTPTGRFITDKKICTANSAFNINEWKPIWNIKSILVGFMSIMLDDNAIGENHIHENNKTIKYYASESHSFNKTKYSLVYEKFMNMIKNKHLFGVTINVNNLSQSSQNEQNIRDDTKIAQCEFTENKQIKSEITCEYKQQKSILEERQIKNEVKKDLSITSSSDLDNSIKFSEDIICDDNNCKKNNKNCVLNLSDTKKTVLDEEKIIDNNKNNTAFIDNEIDETTDKITDESADRMTDEPIYENVNNIDNITTQIFDVIKYIDDKILLLKNDINYFIEEIDNR